jgi:hypothetical protein
MGYDVTFHPVAIRDLQYFVFDVLDDPRLLESRMTELTDLEEARDAVRAVFDETLKALERDSNEYDPGVEEGDEIDVVGPPDEAVRFLAAAVAGCLHPYWINRGGALSFVRGVKIPERFQPLAEIGRGRIQSIPDVHGTGIYENFMAAGVMSPADVVSLARRLSGDLKLVEELGSWGANSLGKALSYAAERGLGLIEASDVFSVGGTFTDARNLRGLPEKPTTPVDAPAPPSAPIECAACGLINTPGSARCDCGHPLSDPPPESARAAGSQIQGIAMILLAIGSAAAKGYWGSFGLFDGLFLFIFLGWGLYLLRK